MEQTRLERLAMRKPSDDWVSERSSYLGGTDISAILGLHPYKTPRGVYMEKKGLVPPVEFNEAMLHGQNLELYVMQLYRLDTGKTLHKSHLYRDRTVPFFAANPDYEIRGEPGLLECKTAGVWAAQEFGLEGDAVPNQYLVQCMWQMALTGREYCDLAVLIGGQDYRCYHIERDEELIEKLKEEAYAWWHTYMANDCPPPLTGNEPDNIMVRNMYPTSNTSSMYATPEVDALCDRLREVRHMTKAGETECSRLTNEIKVAMGECGELHCSVGRITWKTTKAGTRPFNCKFEEMPALQVIENMKEETKCQVNQRRAAVAV